MAKNWTAAEAAKVIHEGKEKMEIADIGKRFPLFAILAAQLNDAGAELVQGIPENISARKIEAVLKGDAEETNDEAEIVESEIEAEEQPKKRGRKKKTDEEVEEQPKKRGRKKKVEKVVEPEEDEEEIDDDDFDFDDDEEEEEEVKPAKKSKKSKKPSKKEVEEDDDDDDDFDFDDDDFDI